MANPPKDPASKQPDTKSATASAAAGTVIVKHAVPTHSPDAPPLPARRNFVVEILAVVIGLVIVLFPVLTGLAVFMDPLRRKSKGKLIRIARLESLPADGKPHRFPVIADRNDAWNRFANEPIGAIYLLRAKDSNDVIAFSAICPHAGCFIGYAETRDLFQCPCHTSSFKLDGQCIQPSPSPRDMDRLKVDAEKLAKNSEIWVDYLTFVTGTSEQKVKA